MSPTPSPSPAVAPARVLVIDDEPQIRRFLDIGLRAQGYAVRLAETAGEGLQALALEGADLVVLDMGLPDRDGMDALRELRTWSTVPVIVLTVRDHERDKVSALDAGAHDYVTKPFGVQEFMARVRACLRGRSSGAASAAVYDDGRLRVDPAQRLVTMEGAPVALTRKEYALLLALMRHPGSLVTQPQLLRELWGPTHQDDTHYLRILVGKLRQKLGDDATAPRWIATEPGVGLRFLGGG
jgi:two-component system KDP operon response regulator KdpE